MSTDPLLQTTRRHSLATELLLQMRPLSKDSEKARRHCYRVQRTLSIQSVSCVGPDRELVLMLSVLQLALVPWQCSRLASALFLAPIADAWANAGRTLSPRVDSFLAF